MLAMPLYFSPIEQLFPLRALASFEALLQESRMCDGVGYDGFSEETQGKSKAFDGCAPILLQYTYAKHTYRPLRAGRKPF